MGTGVHDWEGEGLLAGLDGPARAQRSVLLDELAAEGVRDEELREAVREGRLAALSAELLLGGPARFSANEVAAQTGLDLDLLLGLRRANGTPVGDPDALQFNDTDMELSRLTAELAQTGLTSAQIHDTARVMASALRPLADAMTSVISELSYAPDLSEAELSARFREQVQTFGPYIGPLLEANIALHLRAAVRDAAIAAAEEASGAQLPGTRRITVAFADLVGFTRLGEELPPDELERVASRLGVLTSELLRPPVRLVKTIGDAVMLASPEPAALIDATLDLVEAADAAGAAFPQLRAGIATGTAVARAGDWFGRPVNLASRLTSLARAGSVLATRDVRDADELGRHHWSDAGVRRIRGVPEPVPLHRVRPARSRDGRAV